MKKLTVLVVVLLLAACSSGGKTPVAAKVPASFTLSGDVTLYGSQYIRGGISECAGAGQYVDLRRNAYVVITDAHGTPKWMGTITITSGTNTFEGKIDQCSFEFRVPNVTRSKSYYVIMGRQTPRLLPYSLVAVSQFHVRYNLNTPPVPGQNL